MWVHQAVNLLEHGIKALKRVLERQLRDVAVGCSLDLCLRREHEMRSLEIPYDFNSAEPLA